MIETRDISTFARQVFSRGRGARRSKGLYPEREWFVITLVFLGVFLGGAVLSVWYYQTYQRLPEQVTGRQAVSVPAYQAGAVEKAHAMYAAREEQYTQLFERANEQTSVNVTPAKATSTPAEVEVSTSTDALSATSSEPAADTVPDVTVSDIN